MAESNPIAASSMLINAYLADLERSGDGGGPKVGWDFEDESPGNDARGIAPEGSMPPEVETHLVNAVLTNGARYYVDHAHPELSTPECADARSVVVFDRAAELILVQSMEAAAASLLPPGQELVVYKNNSDGKGNCYGCHENYLMDRQLPFRRIVSHAMAHFVTRQIFTGAGKVGCEALGLTAADVPLQLTQRADFFEEEVGPRDHAQAAHRQHPRRAALRRPEVPPAARHRAATPTCPRSPPSSRSAPPPWCWP